MALEVFKVNMNSLSLKKNIDSTDSNDEVVIVTLDNKAFKIKKNSLLPYTTIPISVLQKMSK